MPTVVILTSVLILASIIFVYEKREIVIEKVVIIALLSSISSVGRVIFGSIPNVQPSSFMIIMAGICFGAEIGVMTGIVTAFASNLILGQGPWTMWQMLAWGLMGLFSGLFNKFLSRHKFITIIYGFCFGFLFGWIMNLYSLFSGDMDTLTYIALCISSFPFDLAHALTNAVLLFFCFTLFIKSFKRISTKYGI